MSTAVLYRAPLQVPNVPDIYLALDEYIVHLSTAHTLHAHCQIIGIDMDPYISATFNVSNSGKIAYLAKGVSNELLETIRSDRGVELVQYNYKLPIESFADDT
jgi:hypothetical protein